MDNGARLIAANRAADVGETTRAPVYSAGACAERKQGRRYRHRKAE
jgi:hypothetical protein